MPNPSVYPASHKLTSFNAFDHVRAKTAETHTITATTITTRPAAIMRLCTQLFPIVPFAIQPKKWTRLAAIVTIKIPETYIGPTPNTGKCEAPILFIQLFSHQPNPL